MHLSFSSPQAKTDLASGTRVKFVMIAPSADPDPADVHGLILTGEETHAVKASELLTQHPHFVFVGGGKIEGRDFWWESNTCVDDFGYDRPESVVKGEELLLALQETLSHPS